MSSGYRLAPALGARLLGLALVVVAALLLALTLLVAVLRWSPATVVVLGVAGLVVVLATWVAVRRVPVLRLDDAGYRVRWVRGAGVRRASWREVTDAVTASPGGIDCVVLRLREGGSTSIPVAAVAVDRDVLVAEVRRHLTEGGGVRPL